MNQARVNATVEIQRDICGCGKQPPESGQPTRQLTCYEDYRSARRSKTAHVQPLAPPTSMRFIRANGCRLSRESHERGRNIHVAAFTSAKPGKACGRFNVLLPQRLQNDLFQRSSSPVLAIVFCNVTKLTIQYFTGQLVKLRIHLFHEGLPGICIPDFGMISDT